MVKQDAEECALNTGNREDVLVLLGAPEYSIYSLHFHPPHLGETQGLLGVCESCGAVDVPPHLLPVRHSERSSYWRQHLAHRVDK